MISFKIIDLNRDFKLSFGTSQGNILSSFLFNIYMTAFDNFVSDLIKKFDKEGFKIANPKFKK
jgi:hypothetical protein